MVSTITEGCLLDVMMVVTPAPVAISAAISFVSIPPVPRLDPSVDVLTGERVSFGQIFLHLWNRTLGSNGSDRYDFVNLFRGRIFSWVGSIQTIDVCKQEKVIGMNHRTCDSRQRVIIAKFNFLQLVSTPQSVTSVINTYANGYSIIFVHDGYYTHRHKFI